MDRQPKYSLDTLPAPTRLHYVKKDQLEKAIPQNKLLQLRQQATATGQKVTGKFLKNALLQDPEFVAGLRNSPLGREAYQSYATSYLRITAPEVRAKSREVRSQMAEPRKGFLGCVATKVDPHVYKECAEAYDKPEYQNVALVPSAALKQSAYKKTGNPALAARPNVHISELPRGLKAYIRQNPIQYMDYLDELRAQAEYLKSVGRGVREEQRQQQQEMGVGATKKKRTVVGQGEGTYFGGCCSSDDESYF